MVKMISQLKRLIIKKNKLKKLFKKILLVAQISILILNQTFNHHKIILVLLKLMSIKSRHKKNSILELKIFSKL
jgi:hypothetical protein